MIPRYQTPEMEALWSERAKLARWAEVERLVLLAWEELGEVPRGTAAELERALKERPLDEAFLEEVRRREAVTRHDVAAFVDALAAWSQSEAVRRWLHYGLTSTDVVDTAQNWALVQALELVLEALGELLAALKEKALRYKDLPTVGRTHGVHAEPTSFGLKFARFYAAFSRHQDRLERARETIGVAKISGAVGNYALVPPEVEAFVAERLGLRTDPVTTQVTPRDRHAEVLAALALLGAELESLALEMRHLARTEVAEVAEGFAKGEQKGSSAMPHKKNPVGFENVSGLARLLRAYLTPALENVPLWHERDISHSSVERVSLPDATTLAHYLLRRARTLLASLAVDEERVRENLELTRGLVYSQRVLLTLVRKGLARDQAYRLVQRAAERTWTKGIPFAEALSQEGAPLTPRELAALFDPGFYLRHTDTIYRRLGLV